MRERKQERDHFGLPGTLPAGLSQARYRDCVDALWAWIPVADATIPGCVTKQDALEAEKNYQIEGPQALLRRLTCQIP